MPKQKPGPAWPVTAAWKAAVEDELTRRGWGRIDLAERVDATGPAISILLGQKTKQSRLVPAVHAALGWPTPAIIDGAVQEVVAAWGEMNDDRRALMNDDDRRALLVVAQRMAKKS